MKSRLKDSLGSSITCIKLDNKYKDIGDMEDSDIMKLDINFESSIIRVLS
jgi:hypothetical protein